MVLPLVAMATNSSITDSLPLPGSNQTSPADKSSTDRRYPAQCFTLEPSRDPTVGFLSHQLKRKILCLKRCIRRLPNTTNKLRKLIGMRRHNMAATIMWVESSNQLRLLKNLKLLMSTRHRLTTKANSRGNSIIFKQVVSASPLVEATTL